MQAFGETYADQDACELSENTGWATQTLRPPLLSEFARTLGFPEPGFVMDNGDVCVTLGGREAPSTRARIG